MGRHVGALGRAEEVAMLRHGGANGLPRPDRLNRGMGKGCGVVMGEGRGVLLDALLGEGGLLGGRRTPWTTIIEATGLVNFNMDAVTNSRLVPMEGYPQPRD
eukprot:TRINITY_DN103_c0_g1_i2.p2 TRINITY_DN103_c0_g1~~TRINITY_DN103_c0_g1_i2.p2  ORF type:complete len:102 (-),score=8.17 TRINITY_DN103_c0_g1_i2:701-1006(-)